MEIIPLGDRVLVKRHNQESKTGGGIITPVKDKSPECTVLSVGPLVEKVKVGDICLLSTYSGNGVYNSIAPESTDWSVVSEDNIFAVIRYSDKEKKILNI